MTDYYVLSPLGSHNAGDVLSFSPEQIGAGVDIAHLTSIGAIRVATPLLTPPLAPTLATAGSGGTVAAGVYTVKIAYVTASGETTPSPSATITTSGATSTLTVNSPAPSTGATGWYAYISQVGGSTLTRQQTSFTPIATNLVLTAPPTSSGTGPRGTNTSGEAARSAPARIQVTHAAQGVGVFTNNGVPDGTTYASIAAYGSICWDIAASPPDCYVQTGTIATPNWVKSGLPGVTSGPIPTPLVGVTPDPTYNPTYAFTADDETSLSSFSSESLVHYMTWTPTQSGTVVLLPPDDDGISDEIDYQVYHGSVIGVDVPSRDGTGTSTSLLGNSFVFQNGSARQSGSGKFDVVAGQPYTLIAMIQYYNTGIPPVGRAISLKEWVRSTQPFGGQSIVVPWQPTLTALLALGEGYDATPSSLAAHAEGIATVASGIASHAEGVDTVASGGESHSEGSGTLASGAAAHAEGQGSIASGHQSHAEGNGIATGDQSHAESGGTASGVSSHAENSGTASGSSAHAEGAATTASGDYSHAEGQSSVASGHQSHAEGSFTTAAGDYSHTQGHHNASNGIFSHTEGKHAVADLPSEHAHSSHLNSSNAEGSAQYSRLIPMSETGDATPTKMVLDAEGSTIGLLLKTNQTWQVMVQVTGSRHDTPGTAAGWVISGLVTATGTPRIIGTPTVVGHWNDAAASGWAVALSIDVTDPANPALAITVTGQAAQTIYWVGTVHANRLGV